MVFVGKIAVGQTVERPPPGEDRNDNKRAMQQWYASTVESCAHQRCRLDDRDETRDGRLRTPLYRMDEPVGLYSESGHSHSPV
jgi:hypothetical protein